jgi:hypothetical protein
LTPPSKFKNVHVLELISQLALLEKSSHSLANSTMKFSAVALLSLFGTALAGKPQLSVSDEKDWILT